MLQVPDVLDDAEAAAELRQLLVVGHPEASAALLRIVDGLGGLSRLTELWLVEAGLRDVAVVRVCVTLEKLVLSTNRLTELPDLAPLSRLHTLWLPGNRIARVSRLASLVALEDLNLADNLICTLRKALTGCKRLTTLNLSGNPLASLKASPRTQGSSLYENSSGQQSHRNLPFSLQEARHLCDAHALRVLSLADPVYGVTPMARLCNYRSCVLLHLPQLLYLDGFSVEPEELTQLKVRGGVSRERPGAVRDLSTLQMSFAELELELESVGNVAMSVHPQGSRLANVCQNLLDRFSCSSQFACASREPLLVSNCLALADSQWLKRHPPRPSSIRRLAPLVRLSKGTRLRRTAARGGKRSVEPDDKQCGMYRVLGPRPELLFLVEFQYECVDDEAADYDGPDQGIEEGLRRIAPWWKDVRAPASVKHPVLDEALLARCVACNDWGRLTAVNLAGRGVKVLGELPLLPCVSHLDLSYNQLGSLGSLYAFPNLRSLNLSFNNFVTLVNMRDLPHLESLNLSWNNIRHLLVVLRSLNKHTAGLRCLQVCHNPVEDVLESAQGRYLAARYLPRLGALDGEPVQAGPVFLEPPPPPPSAPPSGTQSPAHKQGAPLNRVRSGHSPAVRHPAAGPAGRPASSRPASVRQSPSRQPLPPPQPTAQPQEEHLPGKRECGPDELRLRWRADMGKEREQDGAPDCLQPDRYSLSASGRGLTHVLDPTLVPWAMAMAGAAAPGAQMHPAATTSSTSWLGATRWADLSNNLLGEGGLTHVLASLPHLLQLNAARNAIEALPMSCFQHCPGLIKLDLSRNYLRAVPLLKPLQNLQFLDLSSNQLQSLCGLEEMTSLRELHLANNYIRTLQELQPVRRLHRLNVLDLTGNDVSDDINFKKFVIFHLRNLESVNGQEVMDGDLVAARETFGGCLDRDALLTQYSWRDMTHLVELHLTSAGLRQVLLAVTQFYTGRKMVERYHINRDEKRPYFVESGGGC
ncbi:leucine-rich repeat-containing protein 9-like [Frankliniella occidentalis]|uniref:Leucine-rich repeat-containing protein 9-like n=1 Tax=Frankliniella occidentalis TaxID=133901 RepID=A0A9C6TU46_FRAOC|nr:leucine-rich repeat-containing protein 9-like [Frankliniella occidentalis]